MTRLNKGTRLPGFRNAPLGTQPLPSGKTHEGAPGYARDKRTELFLRATTVLAGEGSHYDPAKTADDRAVELVRELAVTDWPWVAGFLPWLRLGGNVRTMPIMLAIEAARARTAAGLHGSLWETDDAAVLMSGVDPGAVDPVTGYLRTTRQVIDAVEQRGDEPTEAVQYCLRRWGKVPHGPIQRGIADAMIRLWRERAVLRYDKPDRPLRFADAIELIHPDPRALRAPADLTITHPYYQEWNRLSAASHYEAKHRGHLDALFAYLLDERHNGNGSTEGLPGMRYRRELSLLPPEGRHVLAARALDGDEDALRQIRLAAAGRWEWTNSWLGEGTRAAKGWTPLTRRQRWELVIPWMGYEALLKNLRNFEQAGIGEALVQQVCARLSDPDEVKNSRQFPFRLLSAHLNTRSAMWLGALERALTLSTGNIPVLDGYTQVMVDLSGSMSYFAPGPPGRKPDPQRVRPTRRMAALLFALALAMRNPGRVDMFCFANRNFLITGLEPGASVLRLIQDMFARNSWQLPGGQWFSIGEGTELELNLRLTFDPRKYTRLVLLTDEQAFDHSSLDALHMIPEDVPAYIWNFAGYEFGATAYGKNKVGLGGLTDASFTVMQRYETLQAGRWPWEIPG